MDVSDVAPIILLHFLDWCFIPMTSLCSGSSPSACDCRALTRSLLQFSSQARPVRRRSPFPAWLPLWTPSKQRVRWWRSWQQQKLMKSSHQQVLFLQIQSLSNPTREERFQLSRLFSIHLFSISLHFRDETALQQRLHYLLLWSIFSASASYRRLVPLAADMDR